MWWIIGGATLILFIMFILGLCKAAKSADERSEREYYDLDEEERE